MEYLYILQQALVWVITIFWLYNIVISVCSLVKLKDKPLLVDKKHKFMALIPAHNEAAVVAQIILQRLQEMQELLYMKDLMKLKKQKVMQCNGF